MKKLETMYRIELTTNELEVLTSALHNEYSDLKELFSVEDDPVKANKIYNRKNEVRDLRNFFGNLIGRRYMGNDA